MALRLDQKARLLAALPVFAAIEPQAVHVLAFSVSERALKAGERLFGLGDASDGGYIVVSGSIRLEPQTDMLAAKEYGPGTLLGETALVSETERPANAIALEETRVLFIARNLMRQVLEEHPDSARLLQDYVANRVRNARTLIDSLAEG